LELQNKLFSRRRSWPAALATWLAGSRAAPRAGGRRRAREVRVRGRRCGHTIVAWPIARSVR